MGVSLFYFGENSPPAQQSSVDLLFSSSLDPASKLLDHFVGGRDVIAYELPSEPTQPQ
jgi:hypothetical protein